MAGNEWLHRTTKQFLRHRSPSDMSLQFGGSFVGADGNAVNTPDWIFNPDLSVVTGFGPEYWIITGDIVKLMSQSERDSVDDLELNALRDEVIGELDAVENLIRAFAKRINTRQAHKYMKHLRCGRSLGGHAHLHANRL